MTASGRGNANNARARVGPATDAAELDDAELLQVKLRGEADARVAAAQAKVDRQREHLAGAEAALEQAIAERDGI